MNKEGKTIWKCPYCKKDLDISNLCVNEAYTGLFIKVNKEIWHTECYRHYSYEDAKKKVDSKIGTYIKKTKEVYEKGELGCKQVKSDRTLLTDWLLEVYNMDALSPVLYVTLDRANKGEYKEYSCKMDFANILAIWQKIFPKLEERWEKDCSLGKVRKGTNRILYDFAIVVSKYEDYCDWMSKLPEEKDISQSMRDWQKMPKLPNILNYKQPKEKTFEKLYEEINKKDE